ncbi:MAG: branched-chain amino acid ABC transporter permease, partial [Bacillota bacterium]|nr:branched-chain amino acid ABC transporter permease [Bacillota bacterium]
NFDLVIVFTVVLIMVLIDLVMKRTWAGTAVRATASQAEVAEIVGINTRNVIAYTFIASGALASVAGIMLGMYYGTVSSSLGASPGTKGFIAALIGGRGQIAGAVLGAIILGLLESLAAGVIGSGYRDLVAFIALVLMFLIKPSGILGSPETR